MAVNALGQTLQLLLNQAPNNDLSLGLKAGDVMQGKILDILPDNRAIIQIKGYNMLAQLPTPQAGQQFSKGVLLDLAVLQAQAKPGAAPQTLPNQNSVATGNTAQGPALTVKLLGISQQQNAPNLISQAGIDQTVNSLPQPSLEAMLTQAKLPVSTPNLQAAQSLIRYGLPVNAQTLNSVLQSAESLIAAEGAVNLNLPQESATAAVPAPVIQTLNDAKTLLNIVAAQPSRSAERPQIQNLLRQIDDLLSPMPLLASSSPAPELDAAPAPLALNSWPEVSAKLNVSLNQVSDAKPMSLQNFSQTLSDIKAALPLLNAAVTQHTQYSSAQIEPSISTDALREAPAFFVGSARREVAAFISRQLAPLLTESSVGQSEIVNALSQLQADIQAPQSARAETLLQSVASQLPPDTEPPQNAPQLLKEVVAEMIQNFTASPLPKPIRTTAALASEFEARDIPAPRIALSALPKEIVVEAVAFLKARQIPISRPAVEAVASQIHEGTDLGQQINSILDAGAQLPQGLLDLSPKLNQEFQNLREFLGQNGIRPEGKDVAAQIRDFVFKTGYHLERDLAALSDPLSRPDIEVLPDAATVQRADPGDTLKAGLLKLRDAVREAGRQSIAQSSPELSGKLEELSSHISSAINGMNTLQMAAKPTPAFDVNTFQIPVFFGGQMQSGQLSIYWKKGRPHELSGDDPVNVVFLLNTRGLGDVKVQLQVWKNECRCKVSVGNDEAKKFIEAESEGLEKSFAENTPFKLGSLDISGAMSPLSRALDFVEDLAARKLPGLNLTA